MLFWPNRLWAQIGFQPERPLVVINSSGASGSAKLWPADHVERLARRLVENHPYQVLLHCGPAERAAANEVADRIDHPRVQSMGRADELPLGLTKAVLSRAWTVVSTDSGPRHIAVALDRPVVGMFGPTEPAWTTTYNQPETALGVKNLACKGCWKKECPLGHHRCMRDLGVETVYGAVIQAMHQRQRQQAA
ncbi:MAG: glycosyltransferase family 9 protein [Aureliella sp.]